VRAGIEPESACTAVGHGRGINVLQKLALILVYASILEAGAVFHPRDVATKQAGPASVKTANKHISASDMIAVLDARHFDFISGRAQRLDRHARIEGVLGDWFSWLSYH
jgi:hypothetical protein